MNFTYQTGRCERMYPEIPFVGCTCIDCRCIRTWRRIKRFLGIGPKDPQATPQGKEP
jgi:hypothetical protein